MKIDLHSHTHYSDGHLSPKELIDRAHNMQVDVLSITDHDTVAAIDEAISYQETQKRTLRVIPGVEISTRWHGFEIHILGLNVDHQNETFLERLSEQTERRNIRGAAIADKLAKVGIEGTLDEAKALAGKGQLTRAHFARVLVKRRLVKDNQQAFKKYLGKDKKAYFKPQWIDIPEAVKWIHEANGQAVIAHPGHYDMTAKWLRRLISEFKLYGGDGMEVIHTSLSPDRKRQMAIYAKEYDLLASAGSDFHFPSRWTELGRSLTLPDELTPVWQGWGLVES
ncbi:PHP domain-containing protein [Alteromonadaceae bacterium M269]|nr:PHP domain-containing protein [Alteromonadaceae bacterium M269]